VQDLEKQVHIIEQKLQENSSKKEDRQKLESKVHELKDQMTKIMENNLNQLKSVRGG